MAPPLVGTVTIGQAPRPDVTPILEAHLPAGTACLQVGVLDGLDAAAISARFGHRPGDRLLVTRLLDGTAVRLDAHRVEGALRERVAWLDAQGCRLVVVLCTGTFEGLACDRAFLLEPDRLIPPAVAAVVGTRPLGVIVPDAAQASSEAGKWGVLATPPRVAAASPYDGNDAALRAAARRLADDGVSVMVLDCIGFTEHHRRVAATASGLPVLLSNAIVARIAGEWVAAYAPR